MSRATVLCTLAVLTSLSGVPAASQTAAPAPVRPAAPSMTAEDSAIRARANALLAKMTPEEKAGQLTQDFYFTFGGMKDLPEKELKAGRVGSLLFVTDPKETNRLQHVAVDESRLKIPLLFGFDVDPRLPHDLPGADRHGRLLGSRARRARADRRGGRGAERSASTGPSRRCSTSPATRAGAASSRAPARIRSSLGDGAAQVRGFQGAGVGSPDHDHRAVRSTSPATAPPRAAATTTQVELSERELRERLPAALRGGGEGGAGT